MSADVVIIGGGVIGLSLARELAGQGKTVIVLDKQQVGREASWAGAGILPPGNLAGAKSPFDRLRALSTEMWPVLSRHLFEETGFDNGYWNCGGLTLSLEEESCEPYRQEWADEGVELRLLDGAGLRGLEPALSDQIRDGIFLPGLSQVRNPWHLETLAEACRKLGVTICPDHPVVGIDQQGDRIVSVQSADERFFADQFCFTAGAWTGEMLSSVGYSVPVVPVRGQIVLYRTESPLVSRVIEVGKRYLVPRDDGRLLVGSTEEDAGFEKHNTDGGVAELQRFAISLVPQLESATVEKTWAGLRPMSLTGQPFLGLLPGITNGFLAAGHFRAGLQTSPATALVMRQLMCGQETSLDIRSLAPDPSLMGSAS